MKNGPLFFALTLIFNYLSVHQNKQFEEQSSEKIKKRNFRRE